MRKAGGSLESSMRCVISKWYSVIVLLLSLKTNLLSITLALICTHSKMSIGLNGKSTSLVELCFSLDDFVMRGVSCDSRGVCSVSCCLEIEYEESEIEKVC